MRVAVLGLAVAVAGCSSPQQPEPAPPPRDANQERLHVPQDAYNLAQIERGRKGSPGLARDLATGRFRYGSKLDDVLAAYKPDVHFRHGEYTTAVYADSGSYLRSLGHTYVVARDGKLVFSCASGCVWNPVFFNGLTGAERKVWGEGYWKARNDYLEMIRQRWSARIAVAGPVAMSVHTEFLHRFE
jgi:hypothetical protein